MKNRLLQSVISAGARNPRQIPELLEAAREVLLPEAYEEVKEILQPLLKLNI